MDSGRHGAHYAGQLTMDQALVAALALVAFSAFVVGCYIWHCAKTDDTPYSHDTTEFGRRILEEDRKLKENPEQRSRRAF